MGPVLIIGSSVGGVRTAQALRRRGHTGAVTIVGAERHLPYDKPPLSKQFLGGSWSGDRLTMLTADDAAAADIDLRLGVAAARVDTASKSVTLEDGAALPYEALVIATGASARRSPWRTISGVHLLRSLDDCLAIRADFAAGGTVLVVGGGFIGGEVASTARAAGLEVVIVDPEIHPMERIVGREMARHFSALHSRHDVHTRFGSGVESITGSAGDLTVTLSDGSTLRAATAVVGIGATPNSRWLADSGMTFDAGGGLLCDADGRVEGCSDVYAVGDVASWRGTDGVPARAEHWTSAAEQAAHVARLVTGDDGAAGSFVPPSFVWSDQHDWKMQIVGRPETGSFDHMDGDITVHPTRAALVYSTGDGILAGVVTINWARKARAARQVYARRGRACELME